MNEGINMEKQSDLIEIFAKLQTIADIGYDTTTSISSKLTVIKYYEEAEKIEVAKQTSSSLPPPDDMINNIKGLLLAIERNNERNAMNLRHLSQII
jgi:hypothetical protein